MSLCDRFHCLPSQVLGEDAEVLRLVQVEHLGRPPQDDPDPPGWREEI